MTACASLDKLAKSAITDDPEPVVLIDGVPEPRLSVASHHVAGPLDIRTSQLVSNDATITSCTRSRWLNAQATIAIPLQLSDGLTKWSVLSNGRLYQLDTSEAAGTHELHFELRDAWTELTDKSMTDIWWIGAGGILFTMDSGILKIGVSANCSANKVIFNGSWVYVLQEDSGLVWTVGEAIRTLSALANLELSTTGLPRQLSECVLSETVDLRKPIRDVLEDLLDTYDLVVQRDLSCESGVIIERRVVRPASAGRPIRINWPSESNPIGEVIEVNTLQPTSAARLWIARADGWRVESTFDLVGGWDPALEGRADDEYDKDDSSNFVLYADVYRRWVLNEDGYYTLSPYNRGQAFNLNAFFSTSGINPQPLRFEDNLTLDEWGDPRKPEIEVSVNAGSSWVSIVMASAILTDRAGIYLDPKTLPMDFLAAAKNGTARVRVTASLTSPKPIELSRWFGNPFRCTLDPKVLDVSDQFRFARIDPQSIHYSDFSMGNLQADISDDQQAMFAWLTDRVTRHANGSHIRGASATLVLTGTRPFLKPGDRLLEVKGLDKAIDGLPQSATRSGGTIRSVQTRFAMHPTRGRTTAITMVY